MSNVTVTHRITQREKPLSTQQLITTMHPRRLAILLICVLSFMLVFQSSVNHDLPLSWDVWYHLRISRQFSTGEFTWDSGSFGPEGRTHSYPPVFHVMTALIHTAGIPLEGIARFLPPFLFVFTIYSFYILVKEVLNEKIALISCLLASVSPIILDRSLSYTPEALSFIFFNVGLTFFWKGNWKITGLLGGLLVLTHGITSVAFFSIILFYTFFSLLILRENYVKWLKHLFLIFMLSALISSVWALQGMPSFVPYGGKDPLQLYPQKLGWIQSLLAFLGLTFLSKDKKSIFVLSFAGCLFLLSQNPVSLPYRFIEFLAFPVCMLAGITLYYLKNQPYVTLKNQTYSAAVLVLFILSFAQGYWYTEKYSPVVTHEEKAAFYWLNTNSVHGYTIMCEWRTAPVLAFFSERAPVKGAYQFGAPNITERTEDTLLFYTEYPEHLIEKYEISHVYYGLEEKKYGYDTPPFDNVYSTLYTGSYLIYRQPMLPTPF